MKTICLFILSCFLLSAGNLNATVVNSNLLLSVEQDSLKTPKAFVMGDEHEDQFDALAQEHSAFLLSECDNDMEVAFEKWLSMLKEMEAYSEIVGYDLKGTKMWLNIFWDKDGTVEHIAYHLKANSRNIDTVELTGFFVSFMNTYKFPLITDEKFAHYGIAAFPTIARRVKTKDAKAPQTDPLVKDSVNSNN